MTEAGYKAIINKFQSLVRSGRDYTVDYMYEEAGKVAYIRKLHAQKIINRYYKGLISQDMIDFVSTFKPNKSRCLKQEYVDGFSRLFNVCERESRIFIRYIKRIK